MLKKLLLIIFLLCVSLGVTIAQTSYAIDTQEEYTIDDISSINFQPFSGKINKGLQDGIYWIKIENIQFNDGGYTIQIPNYHIRDVEAYVGNEQLMQQQNERFATYLIKDDTPVFLKVNAKKEAFIPLEINRLETYHYQEKKNLLLIGFYYGFAFIVILINLFYFTNFKENTFAYYALFLFTISFGLLISDGVLHLYQVPEKLIGILQVIDHILVAIFSALFAHHYLQLSEHYPKAKTISYLLLFLVIAFGLMHLMTQNFIYYVVMESLVFTTFIFLWCTGVSLFRKNLFTKIFVVAYFFILVLGILFYITKLYGLPKIPADQLKIGGFIEMVFLSFAVIYRMKILHEENLQMRNEITQYATQISTLSQELEKSKQGVTNYFTEFDLSEREQEIFVLLSQGKSNKEIAEAQFISVNTVKYHIKKIYSKLNIKNRREALAKLQEHHRHTLAE